MDLEDTPNQTVIVEDPALRQFIGGFTSIPNRILRNPNLSIGAKMAYTMLLHYAWQKGFCFPAQTRLAEDLGCGERSIRRWLNELKASGLVTWKQVGLNKPNVYRILRLPTVPPAGGNNAQNKGPVILAAPDRNPLQHDLRTGHIGRTRTENPAGQDRSSWPTKNTQINNTHRRNVDVILESDQGALQTMDEEIERKVDEMRARLRDASSNSANLRAIAERLPWSDIELGIYQAWGRFVDGHISNAARYFVGILGNKARERGIDLGLRR